MASLRVAIHQSITNDKNAEIRLRELDMLDEKRMAAQQRLQLYQARVSAAFDKRVKYRSFKKGDLVLMLKRPIVVTRRTGGKFDPKWDGPYEIREVYSNGAYRITDQDGRGINIPVNARFLKKYYP